MPQYFSIEYFGIFFWGVRAVLVFVPIGGYRLIGLGLKVYIKVKVVLQQLSYAFFDRLVAI